MGLSKKQMEFLDKFAKGRWTFKEETGLVDIEGDFDCSRNKIERNYYGGVKAVSDFEGVKFGVVTGNFYCCHNTIKSLKGAPQKVGGNFSCRYNKLTNLKGSPQEVGGDFSCSYNKLWSLEGAPQEIGGDFSCFSNNLTSLVGAPQKLRTHIYWSEISNSWSELIVGSFNCAYNNLMSLEGAPRIVKDFYCDNNLLTSLVGAPHQINGYLSCKHTKLTSLEGAPPIAFRKISSTFYKNPISNDTLELVWETMRKNEIDYRTALISLKGKIPARDWKKMTSALEEAI